MSIDQIIPWIISCISIAVAVYFGTRTQKRADAAEIEKDSTATATMMVKLESIADDIKEIKTDNKSMQSEMRDFRERLTINEQSIKALHRRVDSVESHLEVKQHGSNL
jgi:septal ring factor EnvC (AmiA/AmiB activator)